MTSVNNLTHLNLNTGEKTGIEALFADWLNIEKCVNQRTKRVESIIEDLVFKIAWGAGAALLKLVDKGRCSYKRPRSGSHRRGVGHCVAHHRRPVATGRREASIVACQSPYVSGR